MGILWNIVGRFAYALASVVSTFPILEKKYHIRNRLHGPWPRGPYLWMHGASLGECKMLLGLIRQMSQDSPQRQPILLTTQKAEILDKLRSDSADMPNTEVSIAPADTPKSIKRFMDQVQPTALVLAENELWPGYLSAMKKYRGKRSTAVVSARYRKSLPFLDFSPIGFICAQTPGDLNRFQKAAHLPDRDVSVGGNWKNLPWSKSTEFESATEKEDKDIDVSFISLHFSEWNRVRNFIIHSIQQNESIAIFPRRLSEIEKFQKILRAKGIPVVNWPKIKEGSVSLATQFGETHNALLRSKHAIVGGSFSKKLGVHDFWEPILMGVSTSIGPYTKGQDETAERLISHKTLFQISNLQDYCNRKQLNPKQMHDFLVIERKIILDSYQQFLNFITEANKQT